MRHIISSALQCWLCANLALSLSSAAGAAAIAGRVVDGDGRPVAGAQVRVWQKLPGPGEQRLSDRPVRFAEGDDGDVLRTDADGRFQTPDVVVADAFARVLVDAPGLLPVRGDWLEIREAASPIAVELAMRRLRTVIGLVLDRQQRPIEDVTVFHVGDTPEKVESKTDRDGRFRLPDMPEGRVFLFAEKPGYRFTGMLLTNEGAPSIALARFDEPIEPLKALPPPLPHDEELALARAVVERALEEAKSGTPEQKEFALRALAELDPIEAFDRAEAMGFRDQPQRDRFDAACVWLCIDGRGKLSWDDLRSYIESSNHHQATAAQFCAAVRRMGDEESERRLEWLEEALLHARHIENLAGRAETLANVAGAFLRAGERDRAAQLIAEAEKEGERLPLARPESSVVVRALNLVLAKINPPRAIELLELQERPVFYQGFAAELSVWLLPEHPDLAEDIWGRVHLRAGTVQGPAAARMQRQWAIEFITDLGYKLARVDPRRGERLARGEGFVPTRIYGLGAVALALSETEPAAARRLLVSLVREDLPRMSGNDSAPHGYTAMGSPFVAASLLPIAERIDPELARECFWRSLALRPPPPRQEDFENQTDEVDIALARRLSRYDRDAARALLEPVAVRLPRLAAISATTLNAPHALAVARRALGPADVVDAAITLDARWAIELIARLPRGNEQSWRSPGDAALRHLASTLAIPYEERWTGPGNTAWKPRGE